MGKGLIDGSSVEVDFGKDVFYSPYTRRRFKVKPLEFDGIHDSIFHEFNLEDHKHMEYLHDHGSFTDLPFEEIITPYRHHYPAMFEKLNSTKPAGDFHKEAERQTP